MYIKESKVEYDAIVIGSGMTGGWAAKEFCEKGLKTLMLERGPVVRHRQDYTGENKAPWEQAHRTKVAQSLIDQQYSVQRQCYAFSDATKQFFGNDQDLPYQTKEDKPFTWIRGNQLGGRSLTWHRQTFRYSEYDFLHNATDGHGNDWPIRYQDLEKWYSYVERHIGVTGSKEGIKELPDSEFLPPFNMNGPEKMIKAKMAKLFNRQLIIGRAAHLTEPTQLHIDQGRVQCIARAECHRGCSFGAYFSTQSSTLPAAAKTGNLHVAADSVVHSLIYDKKTHRVRGVRVVDNNDLSEREYYSKVVFMCASTLGTTQVLLNSKCAHFPNGLANSSGVLGHYLMDHNYNAGAKGIVSGFDDEFYSGRRPVGCYIPNVFYKPSKKARKEGYYRGFTYSAIAYRKPWVERTGEDGIGEAFKENLRRPGPWQFTLAAHGEMLPRYENCVALHSTLKDKWGIPQLDIHCQWSQNERAMMKHASETALNMMNKMGLEQTGSWVSDNPPGLAIHEMGTARMGRNPKDSIVNGFNQCHDVPNVFITDGSVMCSSGTVNPSLTYMAMTARAVDYAVGEIYARRI